MASQDFIELMTKLHVEKYRMLSKKIEYNGLGISPSLKVTVVLEKGRKQISIQSSEMDFLKYVVELRGVADMAGEHKFARLRDLNQFNVDVEHLIDEDRSKIKKAAEDIISGKFVFKYDPSKLVEEFLRNARNIKDKKFLPLKRDYHYILAFALLESKEYVKEQEKFIRKTPGANKFINAAEQIMKSFRPTGNGIKDYKFYKSFSNFNIDELAERISIQVKIIEDTVQEFIRRGKVDGDIAIPRMMDVYSRCMELSAPVIDLIRIGLELKKGVSSPVKGYTLARNIAILKSDPDFGPLFDCLDEAIRHSDAHVSIKVDTIDGKVHLMDARGRKAKTIRIYKFEELIGKVQVMRQELFPALICTLMLREMVALDLLLVSREYKHLLLALGNC